MEELEKGCREVFRMGRGAGRVSARWLTVVSGKDRGGGGGVNGLILR